MLTIMQGDKYGIAVVLMTNDGQPIKPSEVDDVEISVGSISKTLLDGEISFSEVNNEWIFPIEQRETFAIIPGVYVCQARIKTDDNVEGIDLGKIRVIESKSKEEL